MEGLFKLRRPINLLGYEQEVDTRVSNARPAAVQHTYLSLKLTLQPNIPKLTQSMVSCTNKKPFLD